MVFMFVRTNDADVSWSNSEKSWTEERRSGVQDWNVGQIRWTSSTRHPQLADGSSLNRSRAGFLTQARQSLSISAHPCSSQLTFLLQRVFSGERYGQGSRVRSPPLATKGSSDQTPPPGSICGKQFLESHIPRQPLKGPNGQITQARLHWNQAASKKGTYKEQATSHHSSSSSSVLELFIPSHLYRILPSFDLQ